MSINPKTPIQIMDYISLNFTIILWELNSCFKFLKLVKKPSFWFLGISKILSNSSKTKTIFCFVSVFKNLNNKVKVDASVISRFIFNFFK
jgi:hypothetical protein